MTLGKERLQIVEIDLDYCSLSYATGACTAVLGVTKNRKCFNGYATCQDQTNFTKSNLTLRFAQNQNGLPKGQTVFPCLQSVSTSASSVNLGGMDDKRGPLGKRARITVTFKDFRYHDTYTDKYSAERVSGEADLDGAYRPEERGTFFAKLKARFPFYTGRSLRLLEGYVGEDLADMRTKHYVVTEWKGPDANGNVTVTAKDILDLAENKKALAPAQNTGKLSVEISDETGLPTFNLTPEGVGDSEYDASGRAIIGTEIVTFTRSGDEVTITGRGVDGSEPAEHEKDDTFQQCLRFEGVELREALRDLLRDYASISTDFIPYQDWGSEAGRWQAGFNVTATIPKPTGVLKLIGELCDLGVMLWWDDEEQKIRYRADRPLDYNEAANTITGETDIIEGTQQPADLHDRRVSQVHIYHGVLDYSDSVSDGENFRRVSVHVDLDAEGENEYGEARVKEIFTRWLGQGNDAVARTVGSRRLKRFRTTPQQVKFAVDVKDKDKVIPAALVDISTRVLQDDTGANLGQQMQIAERSETSGGHQFTVVAETFSLEDIRLGFIMPDSTPSYGSASDEEKAQGCFIVNANRGEFGDGTTPYVMY